MARSYVTTATIRLAVKGNEEMILRALGIPWEGGKKHIRCPYLDHADIHPSWRWDAENGRAYCTCGSAAIFDVIAKMRGCDFAQAKIVAAELIGRPDLIRHRGARRDRGEGVGNPSKNSATAQHSTGCALADYAKAKGLPQEFLRSLGIIEISYLCNPAVKIPYFDATGTEAVVRFRIALDGKDKFKWRQGSKGKLILYGLNRLDDARKAKEITIVEGESDCHTLWHDGFPAIGLPGASNWNEARDAGMLDGIETIYVVIEPDEGSEQVRYWLDRSAIRHRVKLVRLVGFKDPSALYLDDPERFPDRWRAALAAAVSWQEVVDQERKDASSAAWGACKDLAQSTDILAKVVEAVRACALVGEERAVKLIYLAVTSRILPRIVSVAIKGPSSGGKSYLVEMTLGLFPPEAVYVLTAMSERVLAYGGEPLAHRIIVFFEAAGLSGDFGTYLIRSLLSEGRISYDFVEKTKDGLRVRRIEREGPTGMITTTTASHLHPENETRLVSVTVTDTQEQTKAIMLAQAKRQGASTSVDLSRWHALQRWLSLNATEVVIPFGTSLAHLIPAVAVRLRRDFSTILALIEAHALLHQANRARDIGGAVMATIEDYAAVYEIARDLISQGAGATVTATVRETVKAVDQSVKAGAAEVSVSKLGKALGIDKSSASRRVNDALAAGYLKNLEDKRGRPARLILGDPMPDDLELLPKPDKLAAHCCTVAKSEEGVTPPPPPIRILRNWARSTYECRRTRPAGGNSPSWR